LVLLLATKYASPSPDMFAYFMEEFDSSARFGLDESLMLSSAPAFDIKVEVRAADSVIPVDQPAMVQVTIASSLAVPITMDRIVVRFASKSTPTRPARHLLLEAVDVDISPGQNKVLLSCNATKGKFKLDNCILQFGQVVFGQDYPNSSQQVTVKASSVTADLDIAVPESMVFDNTQHLQVVISAKRDPMHGLILRAFPTQPESAIQLFHVPFSQGWKSDEFGVQTAPVSLESRGRDILLPDLNGGESLTLFIPCIFPSGPHLLVQDTNMNFLAHQGISSEIEIGLEYRNAAREKKTINKTFDLSFIHPMEAKAYSLPVESARNFLVCVSLRSRSPVPLQLLRYRLGALHEDARVLSDTGSQASIVGTVIRSKETMSLAFAVEVSSPEVTQLELSLAFLLKDKQLTALEAYGFNTEIQTTFTIQVHAIKPHFAARIEHPGSAEVGAPSVFRITLEPSTNAMERFQTLPMFTLCFDEACWAYAGLVRGSVPLDGPLAFSACLVPLRPGSIPLPFIRLDSPCVVGPIEVSMSYSKEDFTATTPPKTFALLNQLEDGYRASS
jgi:hypothetical protein